MGRRTRRRRRRSSCATSRCRTASSSAPPRLCAAPIVDADRRSGGASRRLRVAKRSGVHRCPRRALQRRRVRAAESDVSRRAHARHDRARRARRDHRRSRCRETAGRRCSTASTVCHRSSRRSAIRRLSDGHARSSIERARTGAVAPLRRSAAGRAGRHRVPAVHERQHRRAEGRPGHARQRDALHGLRRRRATASCRATGCRRPSIRRSTCRSSICSWRGRTARASARCSRSTCSRRSASPSGSS